MARAARYRALPGQVPGFRQDGRLPGVDPGAHPAGFDHLAQVAEQAKTADIGAGAVSYTHLRAHETVLDLVCRPLLEKKKNTSHEH